MNTQAKRRPLAVTDHDNPSWKESYLRRWLLDWSPLIDGRVGRAGVSDRTGASRWCKHCQTLRPPCRFRRPGTIWRLAAQQASTMGEIPPIAPPMCRRLATVIGAIEKTVGASQSIGQILKRISSSQSPALSASGLMLSGHGQHRIPAPTIPRLDLISPSIAHK